MTLINSEEFLKFRKLPENHRAKALGLMPRIGFIPTELDRAKNIYKNMDVLFPMTEGLGQYADLFDDDTVSYKLDYKAWLNIVFDFVESVQPWFYIITLDNEPIGAVWAHNWGSFGDKPYDVELGGYCNRGVNPLVSWITFYHLVAMVFESTPVHIIRSEFDQENAAVKRLLFRSGFSHPETKRAWKRIQGVERIGTILSITRQEFEQFHEQEIEIEQEQSASSTRVSA